MEKPSKGKQHSHLAIFAYILQTTKINMDKHSYIMNNDCVLLFPQISTNIVNFSYEQPKFCKQPLVGTDNSQKQEKSIYLSFKYTI